MTAQRALLLVAVAVSCSTGSGDDEARMPQTTRAPSTARRTTVTIPANQAGADLEGTRGFLATQRCAITVDGRWLACHLPPLDASGPHRVAFAELQEGTAVTIENGTMPAGGAAVIVTPGSAHLAGGRTLQIEPDPTGVESTWRSSLSPPGLIVRWARSRGAGRWTLEGYDAASGARAWRVGPSEIAGEPLGAAVAADGANVYLAQMGDASSYELLTLDGASGTVRNRARLSARPVGLVIPSSSSGDVAVLVRDTERCASCTKMVVVQANGGTRELALPDTTVAPDATSAGMAGDALWFYRYEPAHSTSELAPRGRTPVATRCAYERYDLRAPGRPPRGLRDSGEEWKQLTEGCAVRTLIPLASGKVAAIRVNGETELEVVELEAAP